MSTGDLALSKLIVFLCRFVGDVLLALVADGGGRDMSALTLDESRARVGEDVVGGETEGRSIGLTWRFGLWSDTTLSSLRSNRLTKLEFELPQVLAKMPFGMPKRPVTFPRMPRSPDTVTAALLRFVGAGAFANVEGARVLGGMSRRARVKDCLGVKASSRLVEGKLCPAAMEPWAAAIKLAIPPAGFGVPGEDS